MAAHQGKKISKYRQFKGIKQEALAEQIEISQSELSKIENQEKIDAKLFSQIADALGISPELLDIFDEYSTLYHISNRVENSEISENSQGINQVFNPLEKVIELYERLLNSEKEKIEILKKSKNQE